MKNLKLEPLSFKYLKTTKLNFESKKIEHVEVKKFKSKKVRVYTHHKPISKLISQ